MSIWDDKFVSKTLFFDELGDSRNKETKQSRKTGSLIIPFEEYEGLLTPEQQQVVREYQMTLFPDLFDVRGLENDVESEVPSLHMSKPAKLLTSLYEMRYKIMLEKAKKKDSH